MKDLNELCVKVKQLTWENDHTGAKLAIAEHFKYAKYVKILKAIEVIHDAEGCMAYDLGAVRRRVGDELLNAVKKEHGEEIYQKVYNSL